MVYPFSKILILNPVILFCLLVFGSQKRALREFGYGVFQDFDNIVRLGQFVHIFPPQELMNASF